jgi:hypothetical protein
MAPKRCAARRDGASLLGDRCVRALADVSYVQGPDAGIARSSSHAFRIVPIVVVGVNTSSGYAPVKPFLFFTPVEIEELAV